MRENLKPQRTQRTLRKALTATSATRNVVSELPKSFYGIRKEIGEDGRKKDSEEGSEAAEEDSARE
jgi:hypothetical protein